MLIEFIGGKANGRTMNVESIKPIIKLIGQSTMLRADGTSFPCKHLIYRRKPSTNKFYFDKIEEELCPNKSKSN